MPCSTREQLRAAYDQFASIGMEAFAERAPGVSSWRQVRKVFSKLGVTKRHQLAAALGDQLEAWALSG